MPYLWRIQSSPWALFMGTEYWKAICRTYTDEDGKERFSGSRGEPHMAVCHEVTKGKECQWASTNEFNMWLMPSGLFGSLPELTWLWKSASSAVFFSGLRIRTQSVEGLAIVDDCLKRTLCLLQRFKHWDYHRNLWWWWWWFRISYEWNATIGKFIAQQGCQVDDFLV